MKLTDEQFKEELANHIGRLKNHQGFKESDDVKIYVEGDEEMMDIFNGAKSTILSNLKATQLDADDVQQDDIYHEIYRGGFKGPVLKVLIKK